MPCKTFETYPFSWKISCLAPIKGESTRSRRNLGLYEIAFACFISLFPNDFLGETCDRLRFEIRADYRRFYII